MNQFLIYILCFILFIVIDAPYLYTNADLYKKKTLSISGKNYTKRYYSAAIVYLALALGIIILVLPRITNTNNSNTISLQSRIQNALLYGGVFGLVSYATFDFTMHFMFEGWDIYVSILDSVWGGILCSIVSFIISYL